MSAAEVFGEMTCEEGSCMLAELASAARSGGGRSSLSSSGQGGDRAVVACGGSAWQARSTRGSAV